MNKPIAHVKQEGDRWVEHSLESHLIKVAKLAEQFLSKADRDWLNLAGCWHDLGKFQKAWQSYLKDKSGYNPDAHLENIARINHSTAGALHAIEVLGDPGYVLAYIIAGHHAGLSDWNTSEGGRSCLSFRLKHSENEYQESLKNNPPEFILKGKTLSLPKYLQEKKTSLNLSDPISLWIRMLFSSLVDADFLDTESFFDHEKSNSRSAYPSIKDLNQRFNESYEKLIKGADITELNQVRTSIFNSCIKAAHLEPGIFSLTVPTGGGKTLSSLAFAFEHAKMHNKERIIYGIPFTSIIEQNAAVFREFVGDEGVLEHHSNIEVSFEEESRYSRLATENWDAPLIVTTNVQLFESLHASKTSRCRKVHNLRNSIIILDEAQQLPRDFHAPITQVMQQLSDFFGVTWVLCTATQPDLSRQKDAFGKTLLGGLSNVREIVENPIELAKKLSRVDVELPNLDDPAVTWRELGSQLMELGSVLAIVNTRKQAKTLFDELPKSRDHFYLSANMCAEHRTVVISEIKSRLEARRNGENRPLRVVSTQLIEAGVDVDFPVVFRALAGLDSIAQSAGRCNREGKLSQKGKVIVFKPEERSPIGFLRQAEDVMIEIMKSGRLTDVLSPENFKVYFELLNSKGDRDKHGIVKLLKVKSSNDNPLDISFRTAAEKFKLINENGCSVIVPYKKIGEEESPVHGWLSILENDPLAKWVYKKLQRYAVMLPEKVVNELSRLGCLEERLGILMILDVNYSERCGVGLPDSLLESEKCIV